MTLALFPGPNRQVTFSNPNQSRSESAVAINPLNPQNMIAISKKFIDPVKYHFTVEPMVTTDGGDTWNPLPLPAPSGWDGMTDPVVAFDHHGTAFVVTEPLRFDPDDIVVTGMQLFRLPNGSSNWMGPQSLIVGREVDVNDDKSWMACDRGNGSPWKGRVYVAWGVGGALRVARSKDGGVTWIGVGSQSAGTDVPGTSGVFAPEVSVDDNGIVHIVWHYPGSTTIGYTRSTDGGETFEPQRHVVNGVAGLTSPPLPKSGNWAEFPHAKFRVLTLATGCAIGDRFLVAWSDMREGYARIYYHYSDDAGKTWKPSSGQPLCPSFNPSSAVYQFHPQIIADGDGVVACAFYEFGQTQAGYRISTRIMGSFDGGTNFLLPVDITDFPWDPAVNAPLSHGNPDDTFIGEYFGLDAAQHGFAVIWTDTRTGVQELFFSRVVSAPITPRSAAKIVATLLGPGVAQGAGGWVIVGGKIIKVPPRGPKYALLQALAALDAAEDIDHPLGQKVVQQIGEVITGIARDIAKSKQRRG
jgi:hypothetical protein